MPEQTPKPQRRRRSKAASETITSETVADTTAAEEYKAAEPKKYAPPKEMVPLNDDRYMKKPRIGKVKAVRAPGQQVIKPGLGNLKVLHQNPIDYHGNIDVRSNSSGST